MLRLAVFASFFILISGGKIPRFGLIPDGRIVGGVPTTIENFPYQISMRFYDYHRCGGSILKADVIITAAHCVYELRPSDLVIVAGSTLLSKGGVSSQVEKIIVHEDYDPWGFDYDISLLTVKTPFDFSASIQPIDLASAKEEVRSGTKVVVSGWGSLSEGGSSPDVLQYVDVFVVSNEKCASDYSGSNEVTDRMLCAGHPDGGRDACQGDSGGPLAANGKLYGIVSWGMGCARQEYPGVYAKVSAFRGWILDQLK